jgi:hypothetical protein
MLAAMKGMAEANSMHVIESNLVNTIKKEHKSILFIQFLDMCRPPVVTIRDILLTNTSSKIPEEFLKDWLSDPR